MHSYRSSNYATFSLKCKLRAANAVPINCHFNCQSFSDWISMEIKESYSKDFLYVVTIARFNCRFHHRRWLIRYGSFWKFFFSAFPSICVIFVLSSLMPFAFIEWNFLLGKFFYRRFHMISLHTYTLTSYSLFFSVSFFVLVCTISLWLSVICIAWSYISFHYSFDFSRFFH